MAKKPEFTSGERYWLGRGPITAAEQNQAFKYLSAHKKAKTGVNVKHFVAKLRKRRELNRYLKGKEEAATDPTNPWQVLFGTVQTGGTVTCIHTSGPADQPNLYLHLVVTLAAHQITYIRKVYFDGYEVAWNTDLLTRPTGVVTAAGIFNGLVKMQINYGTDSQSALSEFISDAPTIWTSNHRQRGHAHVYFRLKWNETVFKNGTPDITFWLTGKYDVYNPVTTGTEVSGNAAMVLLDYMTNTRYGMGLSLSDFNSTRLSAAVTTCGATVSLAAGGTEPRYWLDCQFGADEAPGALVEDMLASMAGRMVYSEGTYSVYAGEARTPVMTITADMILSDLRVTTKVPRQDSFNSIRGTFVSETNDFEESDFPAVTNSTYVTQDSGVTIYEDVTFNMVTSATRAQRLAKIDLESVRQGIMVEFDATLAAYQAEPGEWVYLTFSEFGWSSKIFEIVRSSLQIDDGPDGAPRFSVHLVLREIAASVFDWNSGMETTYDTNPNTNLPNPFVVADPTGLTLASGTNYLYLRNDGTVFSRLYVTWTAAADAFVQNGGYYELQFKLSTSANWQDAGDVPGSSTSYYILDVDDGNAYDVRIRSVNSIGARGNWVTATGHVVIGKTAAPSDVTGLSAVPEGFGVKLQWNAVADLDVREYEIRIGNQFSGWNDPMPFLARVRATNYYYKTLAAGTTRFRVKAIDTTGNYSTNDVAVDVSVSSPGAPQNFSVTQIDHNVLLKWTAPLTGTFPVASYKLARVSGTRVDSLGSVTGTFFTYIELISGVYTYRVSAVDGAGNEGPVSEVSTTVYPPPDYVFRATSTPALSGAGLTNAAYIAETYSVQAAANAAETFDQHFTNNSKTTVQDFITAGYSFWLEPITGGTGTATFTTTGPSIWAPADASETWTTHFTGNNVTTIQGLIDAGYSQWLSPNDLLTSTITIDVDLGETLPQATVRFDYVAFGSGLQPVPRVSWKKLAGDPYTQGELGSKSASPSNYRYLRLTLTVTPSTMTDWCAITDVSCTVNVKEITDSGVVTAVSTDLGGTTVTFNKQFLDVSSIVATPQGTTELKEVVDFNDIANPVSFKILLFNAAGARATGDVRWTARGVQAAI